jgi:polyphosphate kinase 2 (PPK2 family)
LYSRFFLNVSKDERRQRFLARIDEAAKNWKFSTADAKNRLLWDKYMEAYEDCFRHTSTTWAPWYVVPADQKPYCRLLVAFLIYQSLEKMKLVVRTKQMTPVAPSSVTPAKAGVQSPKHSAGRPGYPRSRA